jgi:hypothetical protein
MQKLGRLIRVKTIEPLEGFTPAWAEAEQQLAK